MSFEQTVVRFIQRHGVPIVYKKVQEGTYDPATGMSTNAETLVNLKSYPKQIKANQYNYPSLIGKEVVLFYIKYDPTLGISNSDWIVYNSKTYKIDSYSEHSANGNILVYKILAVKA